MIIKLLSRAVVYFICCYGNAAISQPEDRKVTQIIRSDALPKMEIAISSELSFLGKVSFDVGTRAKAEEYIFSEIRDGKLGRTFIVHFEHFLADNDLHFVYPRFRMATFGQHEYLHQIFYDKEFELFKESKLVDFLKLRGLTADSDWLMNRYVRAVDPEMKNELILFYLEPGSSVPEEIKTLKNDPKFMTLDPWKKDLAEKANQLFTILSD